jgi:hypothetical protein
MITCKTAIEHPKLKRVILKTRYPGKITNSKDARIITRKETDNSIFSLYFSDKKPAGIDITPYAIKKENGNNPVNVRLRSKLSLTSTIIELRIFVINDITKNISITKAMM